jgi:hypothetical protein
MGAKPFADDALTAERAGVLEDSFGDYNPGRASSIAWVCLRPRGNRAG